MLQSSLKPGLLFQRCSSAYVTRFPVICRTVSSADLQYVPRTSTSTPSTSKIRIFIARSFLAAVTETLEQKTRRGGNLTPGTAMGDARSSSFRAVSTLQVSTCGAPLVTAHRLAKTNLLSLSKHAEPRSNA